MKAKSHFFISPIGIEYKCQILTTQGLEWSNILFNIGRAGIYDTDSNAEKKNNRGQSYICAYCSLLLKEFLMFILFNNSFILKKDFCFSRGS